MNRSFYPRAPIARPSYRSRVDTKWVKDRLRERGGSIADIARAVGKDRTVVSKIVRGEQPMALWMTPHFAGVLGVNELEILRRAGLPLLAPKGVPVISWVAASAFADMHDPPEPDSSRRISFDYPIGPLYALEVRGDSMDRVAPEWSLIVVSTAERQLHDRDLGVFRRDGEATFKRFRTDGKRSWLEPDSWSGRHAPIVPAGDDEIVVLGRVVGIPLLTRAE